MRRRVIIGPSRELLTIHDTLVRAPPRGVRYRRSDARHVFLFSDGPFRPHETEHVAEFLDFGSGSELVHSWRLPVLNRAAWVADFEGFGVPVFAGRNSLHPHFRQRFQEPWPFEFYEKLRHRALVMTHAYADPSCKAVLFFTEAALRGAQDWVERLALGRSGLAFIGKATVVYPAAPRVAHATVNRKWRRMLPFHVLFCGLDFERKNGEMALRTFARLATRWKDAHFTYVGRLPQNRQTMVRGLPPNVEYHRQLRAHVMAKLCVRSHVLFHPSRMESFGMILLEAAAAGAAIVTATGSTGMQHVREIFAPGAAILLDRGRVAPDDEEIQFENLLESLLRRRELALEVGLRAYEGMKRGPCSVDTRNAALTRIYETATRSPAAPPVSYRPGGRVRGFSVRSMTSAGVAAAGARLRRKMHIEDGSVYF